MRGVLCDSKYEELLAKFAESSPLTVGLIIGQTVQSGKDLVVHFAKTQHSVQKSESQKEEDQAVAADGLTNIADINNSVVAEHALNAIRMIVGSFNILGVFVVSESNLSNDNAALQKIKTLLMDIFW
jgi:hypothetical protein